MSEILPFGKKITLENSLIALIFLFCFFFFILQTPIYSPDTYSYLRADITRFPGYVLYLRSLQTIFKDYFDVAAIAGHLLFGFYAINTVFKNCSVFFKLSVFSKILLFSVLIFPFFKPIEIIVNLTSEGIAYPLYLLLISYSIDFLFKNQDKKLGYLCIVYILLCLTRGQFIVIAPIVAFIYLLKKKKVSPAKNYILPLLILLLLPFANNFIERSYRYIFYNYFETPPYSYINAVTLPLYVSKKNDYQYMPNEDDKALFKLAFHRIDSLGLLSSKIEGEAMDKYMVFHNNFPIICNQNIYDQGVVYFRNDEEKPSLNVFKTEMASKNIFTTLISKNFKDWFLLYITGIVYGFKGWIVFCFMIVLFVFAFWKSFYKYSNYWGFLLLSSSLFLSNAMVVALASHSIIRYLFYNYFLGVLILILFLKKIKHLAKT